MMRALKSRGGLTHGRGMTKSVRLVWVRSSHKCAAVRNAMESFTHLEHQIDDSSPAELGKSHIKRDVEDVNKIIDWFRSHNPFTVADARLHSLSTGIAASDSDGINCDIAEEVGAKVMEKMDNITFSEVVLRKVDQVKMLADIKSRGKENDKKLSIDCSILFSRLLVIMQRSSEIEPYFQYELTAEPTSLFQNRCLRKSDKSALARELKKTTGKEINTEEPKTYIIDGGCLLHKVKWLQNVAYSTIAQQYVQYVSSHFGQTATVVFDGYCNGPAIKDQEHIRRSLKASPDVVFAENSPAYSNQAAFLANESNKKSLVDFIVQQFLTAGYAVEQAKNDADTLIVRIALDIAKHEPVTVIANDTDVLVYLYTTLEKLWPMFSRAQKNLSVAVLAQNCCLSGHCATISEVLLQNKYLSSMRLVAVTQHQRYMVKESQVFGRKSLKTKQLLL